MVLILQVEFASPVGYVEPERQEKKAEKKEEEVSNESIHQSVSQSVRQCQKVSQSCQLEVKSVSPLVSYSVCPSVT